MADSPLTNAAKRLSAFHQALIAQGSALNDSALPGWAAPSRLRPVSGWQVGRMGQNAILLVYPDDPSSASYDWSWTNVELKLRLFNADLHLVLDALRPALRRTTALLLAEQEAQLLQLAHRFARDGADDRLSTSARRILGRARDAEARTEVLPGGTPRGPDEPNEVAENASPFGVGDEATPEAGSGVAPAPDGGVPATTDKSLPGGTPGPGAPRQAADTEPEPRIGRAMLLTAIADERRGLEDGSLDPLDPRDGAAGRSGPTAADIADLLAALALHPQTRDLLEAYAESGYRGNTAIQAQIRRATDATRELKQRLTTGDDADDAWTYSPLVLAAARSLGLESIPGFAAFAVDLGHQLGRTRTDAVIGAAQVLLLALTLTFTGPVGAVVVGALDLALSGVQIGVELLREYEQALAADASTFRASDDHFAEPPTGAATGIAVAGALLSAVGLTRDARRLLRTLPPAPRRLSAASGLELDRSPRTFDDHSIAAESPGGFKRLSDRLDLADQANGTPPRPRSVSPTDLPPATRPLTPQQMSARSKAAAQDPGARRHRATNRQPETIEKFRLTPEQRATANRGTVRDATQTAMTEVVTDPDAVTTGYGEVDLDAISRDVSRAPDLDELPRARGGRGSRSILTREGQEYDVFWRRGPSDAELTAWARRELPEGSPDPIVPGIIVSAKNPATVDHIVAVERLRQFFGFPQLTPANQARVLNYRPNLMAVSVEVNTRRGSRTFAEWEGIPGRNIPTDVLQELRRREVALATELQELIQTLLAEQNALRGLETAPLLPPGLEIAPLLPPGVGARLTGQAARGTRQDDPGR
ncbi:hypothetical protein [Cryptosporangium minutisporangium]|uniref:Uncharacterized protein n=1 Tax=Cryptosporangium minutisporangium TaxID=113569 RepID=A0ABP6SRT9_9ACTN